MRNALVVVALAAQAFWSPLGSHADERRPDSPKRQSREGGRPAGVGAVAVADLDGNVRAFLDWEMAAPATGPRWTTGSRDGQRTDTFDASTANSPSR
jgi:hypothetical protein